MLMSARSTFVPGGCPPIGLRNQFWIGPSQAVWNTEGARKQVVLHIRFLNEAHSRPVIPLDYLKGARLGGIWVVRRGKESKLLLYYTHNASVGDTLAMVCNSYDAELAGAKVATGLLHSGSTF